MSTTDNTKPVSPAPSTPSSPTPDAAALRALLQKAAEAAARKT